MKKAFRIIVGLTLLGAAVSCQQFKVDTQMSAEKFAANVKLSCDAQNSYSLSATNPQDIIFNVASNVPWTITGMPEWLYVTPSSSGASALIADVTVRAEANTGLEDRSATLTIKSDTYEARVYQITVNQSRKGKLFVLPICDDFSAAGGPLPFSIETNQSWEVRSDALWLTFSKSEGEPDPDGKPLIITATAAKSNVFSRTATVTVTSGDAQESFEVTQKAHFKITSIAEPFSSEGGSQTFTVKTDLEWSLSSEESWLTFDKTEGVGDGSAVQITATAAKNDSAVRSTTVTIQAGDMKESFIVEQKGLEFNIVVPEDPTVDRLGGEKIVEVNTTLDWTVEVEGEGFTAEKIDTRHFKVTATWNNRFAERNCIATVAGPGGIKDKVRLTQEANFNLENCELLADGSVKLDAAAGSRVYFKDNLRCVNMVLTMGDKHFGDKANFWVVGEVGSQFGSVALYNWLDIGTNTRIRSEGNMNATGSTSYYKSTSYSISKSQLDAMNIYEYGFKANEADASLLDMWFNIDGTEIKKHSGPNPFKADAAAYFNYFFGFYKTVSDGTWYVVKSCDLTVYED